MTVHAPTQGTVAPEAASEGGSIRRRVRLRQRHADAAAAVTPKHLRDNRTAYLMLAPMVILLGIFVIWPLLYAVYLSGFSISFFKPPQFVGLDYYGYVLTSGEFWSSLWVGVRFALMVVPTGIVMALALALFIRSLSVRVASFMKVIVYLPAVVSTVVASVLFTFIYQDQGVANWFLDLVHLPPLAWINDPAIALPAVAAPTIWLGLGLSTLILLAAVLDIPTSYYEAAALEGANLWQQTRYITIPLLKNVLLYLVVTGFVLSIQQFEIPLVMTGGGPANATNTPNLFIFNSFRDNTPFATSFSLAASLLLFAVIGLVSLVIFRIVNSEKAQEG